ncbi:unnamed protein product [Cuscuta europaea]|uniref:Uncharacterized protein n=1 Tax=Cuscuta europaea TaxID=41803 RepID=A0A9P1E9D1_CUSEU|nr:unnamed protein product [Cuscuta europaea]
MANDTFLCTNSPRFSPFRSPFSPFSSLSSLYFLFFILLGQNSRVFSFVLKRSLKKVGNYGAADSDLQLRGSGDGNSGGLHRVHRKFHRRRRPMPPETPRFQQPVYLQLRRTHLQLPAYCVVAVESAGRQIPIAFLERVKDEFYQKYGKGKGVSAGANGLKREFGPKLKEHMRYCAEHPEEMNKIAKVKAQVNEVKGVMMGNIEKVLDRGEKIELLVDKTDNLRSQAQDFRKQGTKMKRKMWFENMKIKLVVAGILALLILMIVLSVCPRFNC